MDIYYHSFRFLFFDDNNHVQQKHEEIIIDRFNMANIFPNKVALTDSLHRKLHKGLDKNANSDE